MELIAQSTSSPASSPEASPTPTTSPTPSPSPSPSPCPYSANVESSCYLRSPKISDNFNQAPDSPEQAIDGPLKIYLLCGATLQAEEACRAELGNDFGFFFRTGDETPIVDYPARPLPDRMGRKQEYYYDFIPKGRQLDLYNFGQGSDNYFAYVDKVQDESFVCEFYSNRGRSFQSQIMSVTSCGFCGDGQVQAAFGETCDNGGDQNGSCRCSCLTKGNTRVPGVEDWAEAEEMTRKAVDGAIARVDRALNALQGPEKDLFSRAPTVSSF